LISGVVVSTFMVASMAVCYQKESFEGNMLLGYAAMLLSFSLVFVGIKNYRDKYSGGSVSFGKAFKIGLYITLVASTVYVIVWLIDYYFFIPDFMDKYTAHLLKEFQAKGPTAAELDAKVALLAGRLVGGATRAIRYTKIALNKKLRAYAQEQMDMLMAYEALSSRSADHAEAIDAIRSGRKPVFSGR